MKKRAKYVTARKLTFFYFVFLILEINSYSQQYWTPTSLNNAPSARSWHTAVWTGNKMIIWGGQSNVVELNNGGIYDLSSNIWTPTSTLNAPSKRQIHTAVWTGCKMIIWGGACFTCDTLNINSGGIYNPENDTWIPTSIYNAPTRRSHHTAVWTGDKMIVWGGYENTGGIYDPENNSWDSITTVNAPTPRYWHTAIWTGSKMIVWGGFDSSNNYNNLVNTGGLYDPIQDSWQPTSMVNAPAPRGEHTAVWTGSEMVIWGGADWLYDNSGGRYNPITDTWIQTSITNAPSPRFVHTAVWTGIRMVVWGGLSSISSSPLNTGGIYDPVTDTWTTTTLANAPLRRYLHRAVWTGEKMLLWGGLYENGPLNSGGIYTNSEIIGIQNINGDIPKEFNLYQNFPNPFNPITKIKYDIPPSKGARGMIVKLIVYDIIGREVAVLVNNEFKTAGRYEINWNAINFASGVYIYRIQARQVGSSTGDYVSTKKMVLVK